jgi:hypothetical protein
MIPLANTASTDPDHKQYPAAIVNMPNHHRQALPKDGRKIPPPTP